MYPIWSKFTLQWLPVNRLYGISSFAAPGRHRNEDMAERIRTGTEVTPIEVVFKDNRYIIVSGQMKATLYMSAAASGDALLLCKVYEWRGENRDQLAD